MELLFKEESYAIMGACFEVYNEMGCGFLESVYQECLGIEMSGRAMPFIPQAELGLNYKGKPLTSAFSRTSSV